MKCPYCGKETRVIAIVEVRVQLDVELDGNSLTGLNYFLDDVNDLSDEVCDYAVMPKTSHEFYCAECDHKLTEEEAFYMVKEGV